MRLNSVLKAVACSLLLPVALAAQGGGGFQQNDTVKNLKVLPKTMTRPQVVAVMNSIRTALGEDCEFCHHTGPGVPRDSVDFASDEKPMKVKARAMLQMAMDINNNYLAKLETRNDPAIAVNCMTCHRGVALPQPIDDIVRNTLTSKGLDSATATYKALRTRYYGSASYDFSERPLNALAAGMLPQFGRGGQPNPNAPAPQPDNALAILKLNQEFFPQSANIEVQMGLAFRAKGDTVQAKAHWQKALQLDPNNRGAQQLLSGRGGRGGRGGGE